MVSLSRVLLSHRPTTPTPLVFSPSLLPCPLRPPDAAAPRPSRFRLSASSIYLRSHILAACVSAAISLSLPEPLFRGICTVSHKRVRPNLPLPHAANGIQIFLSLPRSFASFPPLSRFHLLPRNSPFLLASFSCVCTFAGELFTGEFFSFFLFPLFLFCFAQGVFLSSRLISLFFFFFSLTLFQA